MWKTYIGVLGFTVPYPPHPPKECDSISWPAGRIPLIHISRIEAETEDDGREIEKTGGWRMGACSRRQRRERGGKTTN